MTAAARWKWTVGCHNGVVVVVVVVVCVYVCVCVCVCVLQRERKQNKNKEIRRKLDAVFPPSHVFPFLLS